MARAVRAQRPPTIRDVATEAGVSVPTVSRVLTGSVPVSAHRQSLVFQAMERLGYRPNGAARALVHGRQPIIGVVAVDIASAPTAMISAIEREARIAGYAASISVVHPADLARTDTSLDVLLEQPIAGVVVLDFDRYDLLTLTKKLGKTPLVSVSSGLNRRSSQIVVDDRAAAREVTEHLLSLGHRTVHHVSFEGPRGDVHPRELGWRDALSAAGARLPDPVQTDADAVHGNMADAGRGAVQRLLEDRQLTAVFCANDQIAFGVTKTLDQLGYRVPLDISVAGIDDELLAAYWTPTLTTYRLDFDWAGMAAVQALLRPGDVALAAPAGSFCLKKRDSTAPPSRPLDPPDRAAGAGAHRPPATGQLFFSHPPAAPPDPSREPRA